MEERLQKWIARCGISSRRAAEELLRQGRVTLNGRVAGLGESGDPERDTLLVDGRHVAAAPEPVYLMLNKPRGYVTTLSDEAKAEFQQKAKESVWVTAADLYGQDLIDLADSFNQ